MGSVREPEAIDIYETGAEPEFFITHIGKAESLPGGSMRIYCCSKRGTGMRVEFTVVVSLERLAVMSREAMRLAAEGHNALMLPADDLTH